MRHVLPFTVDLTALSNVAVTTLDTFLLVAHDAAIERAFVLFDQTVTNRGTMQVSIVQNLGDGQVVEVTQPTTVIGASTTPLELEVQSGVLASGHAVYLRIKSTPEGSVTPWWATASQMSGTIHFIEGTNPWVSATTDRSLD